MNDMVKQLQRCGLDGFDLVWNLTGGSEQEPSTKEHAIALEESFTNICIVKLLTIWSSKYKEGMSLVLKFSGL